MSATVTTTVDGNEAAIVLDGTVGAKGGAMIHPSLDDLVRALAKANEQLGKATIAKKRASEMHKDAQGAVNAIVAEIIEHYGEKDPQLPLGVTQESESDDEEEDDEE